MALLLIPAIALGLASVGFIGEALRAPLGDVGTHMFWAACAAAGAIALASMATGRPA